MSAMHLKRWFHNAMYADFQAALKWGYFNKKNKDDPRRRNNKHYEYDRDFQIKSIRKMGLGEPFSKKRMNNNDFCCVDHKCNMAVIGLCTEKSRLPATAKPPL